MTITTATLSSKGYVLIPKSIRDQLHWESGHELIMEATDTGVLLKAKPKGKTLRLEDLRGFLQADGPPVPIEELCKPVEYGAEWEASERRSR